VLLQGQREKQPRLKSPVPKQATHDARGKGLLAGGPFYVHGGRKRKGKKIEVRIWCVFYPVLEKTWKAVTGKTEAKIGPGVGRPGRGSSNEKEGWKGNEDYGRHRAGGCIRWGGGGLVARGMRGSEIPAKGRGRRWKDEFLALSATQR